MPFTTPLVVQRISPTHWMLVAPLSYQGAVEHWTIPEAFVTDFASSPRWLQSVVQATGAWTLAAVLHDAFCVALNAGQPIVSARDADGIFRRVLREEGVGRIKRTLIFTAVRWGALANPSRRPGWLRDSPLVLLISSLTILAASLMVKGADYLAHALLELT